MLHEIREDSSLLKGDTPSRSIELHNHKDFIGTPLRRGFLLIQPQRHQDVDALYTFKSREFGGEAGVTSQTSRMRNVP